MIFVDTIHAVALVNRRDPYHARAIELSSRFGNEKLLTTEAVLLEIGNGLARGHKREAVEIYLSTFSRHPTFVLSG